MTEPVVVCTHLMWRYPIVRWMLEEVGQPYEFRRLDNGASMKSADYLTVNTLGKVPAIMHRGVTVTEAAVICAYLADSSPGTVLAPPIGGPRPEASAGRAVRPNGPTNREHRR
ncbi:MAG: glutathione S-transferase N-terminal domain-containing protein [Hyphomicrobiaceae bacterium]|nr:glutathione S-transferase N-terminal domain-containing protein [Hyphomicrobiaceae bacterium]